MKSITAWLHSRRLLSRREDTFNLASMPKPPAEASVATPGPHPDQVLLLGEGVLAGIGVDRVEDAAAGHIAEELTRLTGAPTRVSQLVDVQARCRDLPALIAQHDFRAHDVIVVVTGASDAFHLIDDAQWRQGLEAVVTALQARVSSETDVLFVGIYRPSTVPILEVSENGAIDARVDQMNTITQDAMTGQFRFVPAPDVEPLGPTQYHANTPEGIQEASKSYRAWAREVAEHLEYVRASNPACPG